MTVSSTLDGLLLHCALTEDLGFPYRDVTTDLLFADNNFTQRAKIISKHAEPITVCGLAWVEKVLNQFTNKAIIHCFYQDGDRLLPGDTLLTLEAPAAALLKSERLILNFLRHLSAIATLTAKYVACVQHTSLKILDTRKTTPGLRSLEKYAVHCGGGVNHRMGLFDAIMVKDTHIDLLGGMAATLERLPLQSQHGLEVIVETRTREELQIVLEQGKNKVSRVLLDNMPLEMLHHCVADCRNIFTTEASGNMSLAKIAAVAETGVDYASVGELTYNAGQVDLSMYTYS